MLTPTSAAHPSRPLALLAATMRRLPALAWLLLPAAAQAAAPLPGAAALAGAALFGAVLVLAAIGWAHWLRRRAAAAGPSAAGAEQSAALQAACDFVWRADRGGRIESIAPAGDRMLPPAIDAAALRGRLLWQMADPQAPCPPPLQRALERGAPIDEFVVWWPHRQQAPQPWLLAGVPLAHGGYAGIARNLAPLAGLLSANGSAAQDEEIARLRAQSARRECEHQLVTRELESFAHSVSHDLRAPLRVVDGFATILLEDYAQAARPIDELGCAHIRRIVAAGARMNAMIDTLLETARMTGRDLQRERVDLSQLAREVADELAAGERTRSATFAIAPGLAADGDRTLLRLVLQNLIGNAFKFTGRVAQAQIAFGAAGGGDGRTVYHVRDNGAGFDPRFADQMFGLFQRFHSASEFPGTGVGLATVQRIVRKHGGRIWAESQPGAGATFYFTLG